MYFTFKGLIQLALPKHHAKVVDGAGVELDPEHHVSGWVPEALVVALQLQINKEKHKKINEWIIL